MPSVMVIEAGRTERHYWPDLWRYRELFLVLASRDLAVRAFFLRFGVPQFPKTERSFADFI